MGKAEAQARHRAELILKVRAGVLTASEAAKELGVSRKTYYKWEHRALTGMLEGLQERDVGRPAVQEDPEEEELKAKVKALERELRCRQKSDELRRCIEGLTEKKE